MALSLASAMACKSSIPSSSSPKYDVFLSFRGKDTRYGFTDHLYAALDRKGILTFKDDKKLKKGKSIEPELLHAIEGSLVYIVVFSKNYASSPWCLGELAKIVDCLNNGSPTKHVLPVFYDVDPSEVRRHSGEFGKAFVKHEERFKHDLDKVQTWKGALTLVANLSGWDVRDKPQSAEIEKIVENTLIILNRKCSSVPNDLVGWQSPVEELKNLLLLGSDDDVRVVGICGMGGIGKTTLTTVLYDKISHRYNACCFIDDLSKIYRDDGSIGVQKQLLFQSLKEDNLHICNHSQAANLIRTRLHHMKALIVLDNVDRVEQLEKLSINREWLAAGSRIIIISRDEHILRNYGVDEVYNVQLLNRNNALQLFCRNAFRCDDFKSDYRKLTFDALEYAKGHPLAIKVLGSFLSGRDVVEWTSALARLRENPKRDIMDVLRISYDGLEDLEKEIFLDLACFFCDGKHDGKSVMEILDIRGFHPDIGIRVLLDKSLITEEYSKIRMHDLFIELGKSIVRQKSPKKPRKWSRLWDFEDLENVLLENKVSKNLEAIVLPYEWGKIYSMRADALSQMSNLNFLIIHSVKFSGSLNYLSNKLRYIYWTNYPFTCLPSNFEPNNLVKLHLSNSSIVQLWKDTKSLYKLRHMNLSYSKNLIKLPDFREVPNLEHLDLQGCIKLQRIDPSIGLLKKLAFVNLRHCENLVSVPTNILGISSLEFLYLEGCLNLKMFDASETGIDGQSTSSSCKMIMPNNFFYPRARRHEDPIGLLLPSLPNLPCLRRLDLSFCNLLQIPDIIGSLHYLEMLDLAGNHFVTLPSMEKLSKLVYLNLTNCEQLTYLPKLPSITVLPATISKSVYDNDVGLFMFNCPSLWEWCYRMAFTWMIQVIEVLMQSSIRFDPIGIVIPGSQIPEWLNKQSEGNTIRLDPPPMHDNHWIGVAYFANFVKPDNYPIGFCLKELGHQRSFFSKHCIQIKLEGYSSQSDHSILSFFSRQDDSLQFVSDITRGTLDLFCGDTLRESAAKNVKNVGYRWVFKEDLQQLNPTSRNSSLQKRKFLTIDDDQPHHH